ncbi:MAG: hypothetical protein LBV68_01695 [Spirochaetaceae bacterium]|jgi:hypothetical protein|nr:hypothetical protein [Spirochaetaceae bacterium]
MTETTTSCTSGTGGVELNQTGHGDIEIDTSSGISTEEQREIIANIDAIAGKNRISHAPEKVSAKKRGIRFPLLINIGAFFILIGGILILWTLFKQSDTVIRMKSGGFDSAEGRLIEEVRNEFDAAREEINKLNADLERAALFEWQMSGFFNTVNRQFQEGNLQAARGSLIAMREFIDTPSFRAIRQIEERREINLAMIETMTRLIDESIRTSRVTEELNIAAKLTGEALRDKENAEEQRRQLETERAGEQEIAQRTIEGLREQNTRKDAEIAERGNTISELQRQGAVLQQTITTQERNINTLQTQNNNLNQQINVIREALSNNNAENTGGVQ